MACQGATEPMAPHIIGIAGPSGSGKTVLACLLAEELGHGTVVIGLDSYYRDLSGMAVEGRGHVNFDAPTALDDSLLVAQLGALARGEPIEKPTYDFITHTRAPSTQRVTPGHFVILEGLFMFYWERVRALLGTKIFLTLDPELCLVRRTARDVRERGRTPESVREQFMGTALPMYEKHVWPTRVHADLVLRGDAPPQALAEQVLAHMVRQGARRNKLGTMRGCAKTHFPA